MATSLAGMSYPIVAEDTRQACRRVLDRGSCMISGHEYAEFVAQAGQSLHIAARKHHHEMEGGSAPRSSRKHGDVWDGQLSREAFQRV